MLPSTDFFLAFHLLKPYVEIIWYVYALKMLYGSFKLS